MGEVVVSRFLDNQPRSRRRLAGCVLHANRALVETRRDRIDLLANFPFNAERLRSLFDLVEAELADGRGHATATDLVRVIRNTDLGGDWLTPHMFLDLLRRHTQLELLPGEIVARPEIGLVGWIQHRIRECLRQAAKPLTREEIISETPELGAFVGCVADLAKRDPMVLGTEDGRFAVI